jgi:hypothetical protein
VKGVLDEAPFNLGLLASVLVLVSPGDLKRLAHSDRFILFPRPAGYSAR